ncbi:hypothetical protein F4V89_23045 [Neorhizobium galegae]|nr:hypothetical protein F4V89_23045 [Neorhizobium galegae]
MELIVTLDHFFQDWETAQGSLWLCVQPHVQVADGDEAVTDWIKNHSLDGSGLTYRAAALSDTAGMKLTPVPFPDGCRVEVSLFDDNGNRVPTVNPYNGTQRDTIVNDLAAAFEITDAAAFGRANREDDPEVAPSVPSQPVYSLPFARGYNESLRKAMNGDLEVHPTDPDAPAPESPSEVEIRNMLSLAFWGGARRVLPLGAVRALDRADWMVVGHEPDKSPVANQHGVCGLLFKIGGPNDLARLSHVRAIKIFIRHANWTYEVQDMKTKDSLDSIEAFFSLLPGFPQAPDSLRPILQWNTDYAYRAYAIDDGAPFTHAKPAAEDWFIRPALRTQTRLKPLRRLYAVRVRGSGGTLPDRLLLTPFLSFKIELKPYRGYQWAKNTPGLWELVTAPDDAPRLARFLSSHAAHDIIKRGAFFDKNGAPVSKAPELVGSYDLPWDAVRRGNAVPTIVYYGDNDASAVILRLPVPDSGGSPRTVAAERVMPGGHPNPFGDRWEVNFSAVEILDDFDVLRCIADPVASASLLPDMAVMAVWPGEVAFEFAQSVSSIEGNVKADYEHPPEPASARQVTPDGEYTHDLINYNALNVYLGWNEGKEELKDVATVEHFNKFSELYPIKKSAPGNGRLYHSFVFRSRPAASAPPDGARAEAFFDQLYSAMPDGRRLGFDLEHTYGTRIEGGIEPLMAAHFDFPPLPASRVSRPKESGRHSSLPLPSPHPFARCLFYVDGGDEKLKLIFERKWLLDSYAGDPLWGPVYVQAWRSVAELAFAKSIHLTAQCLVYDFTRGANVDSTRLLAAFKEDEQFKGFSVDCTEPLQDLAQRYLRGHFPTPDQLDITLTSGSQPRIANRCHVAEFALAIERSSDRMPHAPQSETVPDPWKLFRFKTDVGADDLFTMDGQAVDAVTEDMDKRAFSTWMASLRAATASFEPDARSGDMERTALLRKLLSGDHDDNRQWVAPGGAVAGDGREMSISACPIGFRPLAIEPTILRGQTSKLLSLYMQALAILLDCSSLDWATNWKTPAQWRAHFDLLQQESASIVAVVERSVDLLFPLPDSRSGMGIDPIVQQSVAAWKDPGTGLKEAFVAWSRSALLQDPSLFVAAKALLYTRLWGKDGGPLANTFFRLRSLKEISEETTDSAGKVFPAILDDDTFTYREGLGPLAGTRWFGFAEVLDDLRYDSQFSFKELAPTTVETFLERALANEKGKDPPTEQPMPGTDIHVPGPDRGKVPLAARAPVTPPVSVFAGEIEVMIEDTSADKLAVGQVYGRQAFLSGRLELASSGSSDVVELVGRSNTITGRRGQFKDDFVLSAIFAVRGDEEAEYGGWTEAWDNDRFYLEVGMGSASLAGVASSKFVADVQAFFDRLATTKNLSEMKGLEAAYDPDILNFVEAAMTPTSTQTFNGNGRWYAKLSRGNPSSLSTQVLLDPAGTSPGAGDPLIEVFAFRPVDPSGPSGDEPHLYLLVNFLCKNWAPQRLAIEQTRNINVGFAPEFGSTAKGIGAAYQPFVSLDLYEDLPPVRLARRKYRMEELVGLLLSQGVLENLGEAAQHDLSLTVSHDQIVQVTGEYLNASGNVVAVPIEPVRSALPVSQVIHLAGAWSGVEVDLTSFAYPNVVVDFQWSSKSNLQFFRIHSRRAILI